MSSLGYEPPEFFEAAGHLHGFLARLARHRVRASFGRSMTLEWVPPQGRAITLAYVSTAGFIWTDVEVAKSPAPNAEALAHRYVERLAEAWGMAVNRDSFGVVWTVSDAAGRLPNLEHQMDKLDVWADAIAMLTDDLTMPLR